MRIVTRQAAIEKGLKRYYTGRPCKKGHKSQRYTLSCSCVQCITEGAEKSRAITRAKMMEAQYRNDAKA